MEGKAYRGDSNRCAPGQPEQNDIFAQIKEALADSIHNLRDAGDVVDATVSRIIGHVPQSPSNDAKNTGPLPSWADEIRRMASEIHHISNGIRENLERLR